LELAESSSDANPDRSVDLVVRKEPGALGIHLRWLGTPCPPDAREPSPGSTPTVSHDDLLTSGMGSRIIHSLFDEVTWDEDGFGVWLKFLRPTSHCAANLFHARSLAG
jgi:anti-sigma regulatory factor (Ser/Thr protein kinase)